jgi:large subunit ribosomal protein L19
MEAVEKDQLKPGRDDFCIGDTVDVHVKIVEGEKERIQIFTGTVIAKKGSGPNASFTVRRLVGSEGVERVFPLHSPSLAKIKVRKRGRVRRAKLYYLRDRVGKGTKVAEKRPAKAPVGGDNAAMGEDPSTPPEEVGSKQDESAKDE